MSWCHRASFALMTIALLAITGCPATQTADPVAPQAAAPRGAPVAASSVGDEHVSTPRYRIDVSYPALTGDEAPLSAMLHRIAKAARQGFLQALPDPRIFPEFANRQLQLRIDFRLAARSNAFTSIREAGFQDTGGAHPAPIDAAIVYDIHAQRTVPLDDLFARPGAARKALADFARAGLTEKMMAQAPRAGEGSPDAIREWKANAMRMIADGTAPTQQNFANFIVRAGANPDDPSPGLTLIFPPYQVAAYVYGTQTVDVPARVFAAYLEPRYQAAFATD
ncbi:MAG TPA: RsiV family protein [Rhodanobacteraceae bacterium]|nr:RsiV family protein [Rhodanobacteraceae bacterium]